MFIQGLNGTTLSENCHPAEYTIRTYKNDSKQNRTELNGIRLNMRQSNSNI